MGEIQNDRIPKINELDESSYDVLKALVFAAFKDKYISEKQKNDYLENNDTYEIAMTSILSMVEDLTLKDFKEKAPATLLFIKKYNKGYYDFVLLKANDLMAGLKYNHTSEVGKMLCDAAYKDKMIDELEYRELSKLAITNPNSAIVICLSRVTLSYDYLFRHGGNTLKWIKDSEPVRFDLMKKRKAELL